MKEHPILFKGPLVRAILEDRKTVTRRALKMPHALWETSATGELVPIPANCPYGKPGDRLWVRETFIDLRGTGVEHRPDPDGPLQRYAYAADCRPGSYSDEARKDFGLKYKPSIHMPRAACRILLEITAVHVERLQDISAAQALAEGVRPANDGFFEVDKNVCLGADPRESFEMLWRSTGGDWDGNPWVWVVEFKRVTS